MRAFNLDQVCERLGVKRRFLADWLRAHRWDEEGNPYYSRRAGKVKLFTEGDIARVFAALPRPEGKLCHSISRSQMPGTRLTASEALTSRQKSISARDYVTEVAQGKNSSSSKKGLKTNVIALAPPSMKPPQAT